MGFAVRRRRRFAAPAPSLASRAGRSSVSAGVSFFFTYSILMPSAHKAMWLGKSGSYLKQVGIE